MYIGVIFVSGPVRFLRARGSRVGMSLRAMAGWRARSLVAEPWLPKGAGAAGGGCVCGAALRD